MTPPPPVPSPAFATSFWTPDYRTGLAVLFQKLGQGVAENSQLLDFIGARIAHETAFAAALASSPSKTASASANAAAGFDRDEGASIKQAFARYLDETAQQAAEHGHIASALERTVRTPFAQYARAHADRIDTARAAVQRLVDEYAQAGANVGKAQQAYFAKARKLEDFTEPARGVITSPSSSSNGVALTLNMPDSPQTPSTPPPPPAAVPLQETVLGSLTYTAPQLEQLLKSMLGLIPRTTIKLPILGAYENVSSGEEIVHYVRKFLAIRSLGDAEKVGQGLVDNGFLRLLGAVGSKFAGVESAHYQWQSKAFDFTAEAADQDDVRQRPKRASTLTGARGATLSKLSLVSGYFSNLLAEDDLSGTARESHMAKLQAEIADADARYQELVAALDMQRCGLERQIHETLVYMQQCERDRMAAVKRVMADFVNALGSRFDALRASTDRMRMHQQIMDPLKDLNYLIDRYKTGPFAPTPVVYDNFFKQTKVQTFGVDLKHSAFVVPKFLDFLANERGTDDAGAAAAAAGDAEQAPSEASVASDKTAEFPSAKPALTVTTTSASAMLEHKRSKYRNIAAALLPVLVALWTGPQVPSVALQTLRGKLNTGREFSAFEVFGDQPLPVVVATAKEYLLELPDSVVSSTVYDVIKTTYAKADTASSAMMDDEARKEDARLKLEQRLDRLVGLLSHLPQVNVDTLQLLVTHFAEIAGLPESGPACEDEPVLAQVKYLARALAPYILRPRATTALTLADTHPHLFLADLMVHRDAVFADVQQRLSVAHEARTRSRSASSSEANRRFQIEARNREIAAAAVLAATGASSTAGGTRTSSQTLRPLTLARRKSEAHHQTENGLLSVAAPDKKSHRRSLSSSSPLSLFLSPGPPASASAATAPVPAAATAQVE